MKGSRVIFSLFLFWIYCLCSCHQVHDSMDVPGDSFPNTNGLFADSVPSPIQVIPEDSRFVVVTMLDTTILTDIRYAGNDNFVGRPLNGYLQPLAILTRQAGEALARANAELRNQGLVLLIYDAYRPQRAVDDIMQWSHNTQDTLMRSRYYPHITKLQIRQQGFVSKRSKHAMGSTVDLTIADLGTGKPLDMGSHFDLFEPVSHYGAAGLSAEQMANRKLLRSTMSRYGFYPIEAEWWHFTLRHQPYSTPFNFPVHIDSVLW